VNWATYNLAFFFGPGLPLILGGASGPRATAELLLMPFFFTPSDGGGIDDGVGVPLAAGVFEADSDGLSPCELAATGMVFDTVGEDESLEGDSSLTSDSDPTVARLLGDSFNVTSSDVFDDFRRTVEAVAGCLAEGIVRIAMGGEEDGGRLRCRSQVGESAGLRRREAHHPGRGSEKGRVWAVRDYFCCEYVSGSGDAIE
jgi:hypothetical protein